MLYFVHLRKTFKGKIINYMISNYLFIYKFNPLPCVFFCRQESRLKKKSWSQKWIQVQTKVKKRFFFNRDLAVFLAPAFQRIQILLTGILSPETPSHKCLFVFFKLMPYWSLFIMQGICLSRQSDIFSNSKQTAVVCSQATQLTPLSLVRSESLALLWVNAHYCLPIMKPCRQDLCKMFGSVFISIFPQ